MELQVYTGLSMSVQLVVKVAPSSGRQAWSVDKAGQLKCYLKSPPEKGLANKELVKLLASALKVSQDCVSIVGGLTSRTKRILIQTTMTLPEVEAILGIERQQSLL
jgi:uncharacterized protein (TIGR00251 family)